MGYMGMYYNLDKAIFYLLEWDNRVLGFRVLGFRLLGFRVPGLWVLELRVEGLGLI